MKNEPEAPDLGYLICKNGMFYRPDSSGYTSAKSEAGRYSLNMAIDITHPNGPDGPCDGMTYIHETEVADPRADLSDAKDKQISLLGGMVHKRGNDIAVLKSDLKKAQERITELEVLAEWQPIETAPKDGTIFDVWCASHKGYSDAPKRISDCRYSADDLQHRHAHGWFNINHFEFTYAEITHWMPLPASPSQN